MHVLKKDHFLRFYNLKSHHFPAAKKFFLSFFRHNYEQFFTGTDSPKLKWDHFLFMYSFFFNHPLLRFDYNYNLVNYNHPMLRFNKYFAEILFRIP